MGSKLDNMLKEQWNKVNQAAKEAPLLRDKINQPEPETEPVAEKEPDIIPNKEQVANRTKDKADIAKPIQIKNPGSIDTALSKLDSISGTLSEEEQEGFNKRLSKITEAKDKANKEYARTKDRTKWLGVAETLGHALTQLGAGAYGLKHNIDMSGVKFNKNNWSKEMDRASDELDRKLGVIKEDSRQIDKDKVGAERNTKDKADFTKKTIIKDYMTRQQAYNQQVLQAQKIANVLKGSKGKLSPEAKRAQADAKAKLNKMITEQSRKVQQLDKAYAAAQSFAEGEKNSSMTAVAKALGGEIGSEFRDAMLDENAYFFKDRDKEHAPKVVQAYLNAAKDNLNKLKNQVPGQITPSPEDNKITTSPGKILVIDNNGVKGEIPESQKEEAIKQGYKVID